MDDHSTSHVDGSDDGMPSPRQNAAARAVSLSKSYFSTTQYQLLVSSP
ncbi:MAG: hypothetical protein BWX79_01694 [Alphaproteobacteria bacterium ADurb.Bin100]|nr:MAG: hypothetical protein BWX79_01694 [Alphaproteobacteria bacterium ADurb.Bin100]